MLNGFKAIWLDRKISIFIFIFYFINLNAITLYGDVVPFSIKIESRSIGFPGDTITFDIIKTGGSETAYGFDFMIGYDRSKLYQATVSHGEIYSIPGEYEWELIGVDNGPFPACEQGGCPSGLIEITSLADSNNGPHHPNIDPETGKIKVITDQTVLFSITFRIVDYLDPAELYVPVYFFWTLCSDNQIAYNYPDDGIFDIRSAFSRLVMDSDGLPGWINITDYNSIFPTNLGAPEDCILLDMSGMSERLSDFFNGGFGWGCADVNSDGTINILDAIFLIDFRYKKGPQPDIPEFGDLNYDYAIDILDVIYLIDYIYKDGPQPNCP